MNVIHALKLNQVEHGMMTMNMSMYDMWMAMWTKKIVCE